MQHFDRDRAIVLQVAREVHRRHTAAPKLALDRVAVGEGGTKWFDGRSHWYVDDERFNARPIDLPSRKGQPVAA